MRHYCAFGRVHQSGTSSLFAIVLSTSSDHTSSRQSNGKENYLNIINTSLLLSSLLFHLLQMIYLTVDCAFLLYLFFVIVYKIKTTATANSNCFAQDTYTLTEYKQQKQNVKWPRSVYIISLHDALLAHMIHCQSHNAALLLMWFVSSFVQY